MESAAAMQVDRLRDLRERALDGARDLGVFGVDDAGDFERRLAVEIGGGGVRFLGAEAAKIMTLRSWFCQLVAQQRPSLARSSEMLKSLVSTKRLR